MAVSIQESIPSKFYETLYVGKSTRTTRYPDWKILISNKPDFYAPLVIELKVKRYPFFDEIKRNSAEELSRQIQSYWRACSLTHDLPTWRPRVPTIMLPRVANVRYNNRERIDSLLGSHGKNVIKRIINLINEAANEENWPLNRVEVNHITDLDVKDWQYILFILLFNSDFNTADKYLHEFYKKLDILTDTFNDAEQNIFLRNFFFDVKTTISNA